jgi:hypothetical protein
MPNCDFYGLESDLASVLEFVFCETGCRVFESYSAYGRELLEFRSVADLRQRYVLGHCQGNAPSILLSLLPESAGELVRDQIPSHVVSAAAPGRFAAGGWGLIQLQLGGESPHGIVKSHTNHNSEKRAAAWEHQYGDAWGSPASWDWSLVASSSRRINDFVRKMAITKDGSRPVLPAAAASNMPLCAI